ncbi:L-2-hydroxyglutarate oxidase [Paracoccus pacificus]|uniref:L-2-hydroxyglutarate oxidase n=1 Tax=Paracoccus pacificus TaxID=1463598 RepID=A0ABW4R753_9RHOB
MTRSEAPGPATDHQYPDLVIVGGGIVGLATGLAAQSRWPGARILILEQEERVGLHQTGRNSGVIHAGVYYAPGSLKAQFCRIGAADMRAFCDANGIPHQTCGKLIVATEPGELPRMRALLERARANGIRIEEIAAEDARRMEPNIRSIGALLSPDTGIVDFGVVAARMAQIFTAAGGTIRTGARVTGGRETGAQVELDLGSERIRAGRAVFCAGLWADRLARAFGAPEPFRIIPFRGEYFRIRNQPADLVSHLIYPVPDPERPFLGVHLTRKMDGGFTVGPNAVLAGARDGYSRLRVSPRDMAEAVTYPGFWRMLARNAGPAMGELAGSVSKRLYLRKVQRYCPRVGLTDLTPYRAGIRAQAVAPDGRLIDDFLFARTPRTLHVCNAPSPAATSSLPIGRYIVSKLGDGA